MNRSLKKLILFGCGALLGLVLPGQHAYAQEQAINFPLSVWTAEQTKALPETFWRVQRKAERSWPVYIANQEQLYHQIYGTNVGNAYDVFLLEQGQAAKQIKQAYVTQPKTLKRLTDLATIPGKSLSKLKNTRLGAIRVMAFKGGALRVIPHDIIEVSPTGRLVLPFGPEGNPGDGDGVLGDNDLLFFMAMDAGDRVDPQYIKNIFHGALGVTEIELGYAPDKEQGWVYIAFFGEQPPEKSPLEYIKILPEASLIYTPYALAQTLPRNDKAGIRPTIDVCTWAAAPSMGGAPRDIHHKLRLNLEATLRGGFKLSQDQDASDLRFRAWYAGPVIVYGRASWKIKTPLGIGAPVVFADLYGTAFSCTDQNFVWTAFDPTIMMKTFNTTVGEELNRQALGPDSYVVITARDRKTFSINAQSPPRTRFVAQDSQGPAGKQDLWHVQSGRAGSMVMYVGLSEAMMRHAARFNMLWEDSPEHISTYLYNLDVTNFKNRQEQMFLEWNMIPHFWNTGAYRWENLDLVLKHRQKPLTFTVDGTQHIVTPRFIHIPNIKEERRYYRY